MKFNKIMVVSILLLAIFMIGAASAADENVTDTADDVLAVESVGEDEISASAGTFADLQSLVDNTASGKTLYLDKDYSTDKSRSTVKISNSITIDGKGHTIDANKKSDIFLVNNKNVVLKNINFINSYANSGAVVSNYKDCSIINCSFDNCGAYGDGGGAIYQANAYNCSFVKCSSSADWGYGGAISYGNAYNCYFESCNCIDECKGGAIGYGNAYNCSFVKCTSWEYGGAIYKGNAFDSYFKNCGECEFGGAIFEGNAYNCSFVKCTSWMYGGAICDGNAYDCSFVGCSAIGNLGSVSGGAISEGDAHNCSFVDCSSSHCGGAIGDGSAFDCLFINCSARYGGAIDSGNAYNCLFINCSAKKHGAVIYYEDAFDSFCVNCHDAYDDELSYPTAWSEDNYNEGNYALKSDSPFIYAYVAANSIDSNQVIVVAKMASGATGNVKFTINGVTKKVKITNGKAQTFYDLAGGTYPVDIKYDGNNNYPADSISTSIEIEQQNAITSVSADDVEYGQDAIIKIKVNKDAQGNLDVTVNNITQNVKITGDTLNVSFTGLKIGSYDVTVSHPGSDKIPAQNMTSNFNVVKGTPIVSVNVSDPVGFGDDAIITVEVNNVNGNIWFTVSDENKTKILTNKSHIEDGIATISIPGLGLGKYYLHLYFAGNVHYNAQTIKKSFEVVKKTPIVSVNVSDPVGFGDDAIITVEVNNVNGNVWFTVSDENKTKILTDKIHIEDGVATRAIPGLGLGKYYLHIYYAGNVHYNAQTIKKTFEVVKKTPIASVNVSNCVPGEDILISAKVNNVNGNIWFTISDENKTKILTDKIHIENGWANATIPGLGIGKYYLHIYYAGNVHYAAQTIKSSFEVAKISPALSVAKTTVDGKTVLTASVAEDARGNLKFEVNGTVYKVQIVKGVATLTLPDMEPGTYTLKTSYAGNYKYLPETKTRSITIK